MIDKVLNWVFVAIFVGGWLLIIAYASGVFALEDDLDKAYQICSMHKTNVEPNSFAASRLPPFEPGWEHCVPINDAWTKRDSDSKAMNESANPSLKFTREFSKGLKK